MAFLAGLATEQDTSMKELWGKLKGIYTYGQPMVISSNMKCVQECHNRIGDILFRHVYQNDIVPHVPPLSVGAFDHVGTEYRYKHQRWIQRSGRSFLHYFKDQSTQIVTLLGAAPFAVTGMVMENITWLWFLPKSPWSITDHSPLNYMEAMWRYPSSSCLIEDEDNGGDIEGYYSSNNSPYPKHGTSATGAHHQPLYHLDGQQ